MAGYSTVEALLSVMDGWYGTEGKYRGYIAELTAEFCVEV
jgi:hypothetical protein